MRTTPHRLSILVGLLLLATLLAAIRLHSDLLFVDEYWSIRNSGGFPYGPPSIDYIWYSSTVVDPGGMGVLYHFLLGAYYTLVGSSVFVTRLFSLLFGLLTIAATYRLGSAMFQPRVGIYAAAVLASTAFFLDFMHEARAYTFIALLTVLAVYSYWRLFRAAAPHAGWYIGLTLTLTALAYTHYVALVMAAALGLFHLLRFRRERRWWLMLAAMIVAGLLVLPWLNTILLVAQRGVVDSGRQATSMNGGQIIHELLRMAGNGGLGLLALLALYALRQRTRSLLLIGLWIVVSVVLVLIVNARIPFMVHLRYLMPVFPALALLVGLGIERLARERVSAALVLLVWLGVGVFQSVDGGLIAGTFGQIYRAPLAPILQGIDSLRERAEENDLALLHIIPPTYEPFNYFVLDYYFHGLALRYDQFERMGNSAAGGDNDYLRDVDAVLADVDAIWTMRLTDLPTTQKSGVVNYALTTRYSRCEQLPASDGFAQELYMRQPAASATGQFLLADGTAISAYDLGRGWQDDSSLHMVAGWHSAGNLPIGVYSFGLHLRDSSGDLLRQVDSGLPDQRPFACAGGTLDLNGLAAGDYTLHMVIYDWQTLERLVTVDGSDSLPLREVTIP